MTNSSLNTYRNFPTNKPQELERVLVQMYTDIANAANLKDVGRYEQIELVCGQQYYNLVTPTQKRFVYRKVFETGGIVAGAVANIAHGIAPLTDFTRIYGTIHTVADWRPLPYIGVAANDYISILVTAANIVISVGAGSPNIVSGRVVLEYFKS